ncbi:hypothetical protein FAK_08090 [Desulfoferula mesophila]|uniref:Transposase n=1 Tax=Desulfoferula mesophila TaxID=3058419 RepID=A0AAU9E9C9_9BACT|nr:hypothetical protein FAK_08090 [Desulfoferula mesophilus]
MARLGIAQVRPASKAMLKAVIKDFLDKACNFLLGWGVRARGPNAAQANQLGA